MSLSGLLETARSGIAAQSGALSVTGQNVANATTVGYTRRVAQLSVQVDGSVQFTGTARTVDRFALAQVVDQQGAKGSADARSTALAQIESIVAPPGQTIGDRATALLTSFNTLAASPGDPTVRSDVLAKADDLATAVATTAQNLSQASKDLFSQAQAVTGEVNVRLAQVADLNGKISNAQAEGGDAAGLRDQRDLVIGELGQRIGVRAVEDAQGKVSLFAAGTTLVDGGTAKTVTVDLDTSNNLRFNIQGVATNDITARVTSGTLGGLRQARDVDLVAAKTGLDSYAYDVSNTINTAHAAGYGLDGGTGRSLFVVPTLQAGAASAMAVDPGMVGQPNLVAASGTAADVPGGNATAQTLAQLSDQNAFGGTTLANRFGSFVGDVGARKSSADSDTALRADTLSMAKTMSDSAGGVSLDEEMINMSRYQRAFEASSKVMRTADDLLAGFIQQF